MSSRSPQALGTMVDARWWGSLSFHQAHERNLEDVQRSAVDGRARLLFFEPNAPVLTLGRRLHGDRATVLAPTLRRASSRGIEVLEADRGGQATLHLPGQLVLFVAIPGRREQIASLLDTIFSAIESLTLAQDVTIRRGDGDATGLWVGSAKLASAGLRVAEGVIRHGVSLNVAIDRSLVAGLTLCGHQDARFIDLKTIAEGAQHHEKVSSHDVARQLCGILGPYNLLAGED